MMTEAVAALRAEELVIYPTETFYGIAADPASARAAYVAEYRDKFANPYSAAALGYIDEVILPRNTRRRICRALNMLRNKTVENPWKKHDNIPL